MSDTTYLDLEPGLHYDESSRTLAEVTGYLYEYLEAEQLFEPTDEDREILESITQDPVSGLYQSEQHELVSDLYESLVDIVNINLPDDFYFGYLNEGGGWGVWAIEGDEL